MRQECPGSVPCLQLQASAGASLQGGRWERTNGDFRRLPLGVKKIGAAGRGESIVANDLAHGSRLVSRPWWAAREKLEAMVAHPLGSGTEVLGVLAVFLRRPIQAQEARALRMYADQAAALIGALLRASATQAQLRELQRDNARLQSFAGGDRIGGGLIGESPALTMALDQAALLARGTGPVLVQGEPGTGKGLYATAIHDRSDRASRPLVRLASAGSSRPVREWLELTEGGTLLLDEVTGLTRQQQDELATLLAPGASSEPSARVVATTSKDLRALAVQGHFSQDLYLRLAPLSLAAPPLRERKSDLTALAAHITRHLASRRGLDAPPVGPDATRLLEGHPWPGNAQELALVLERALVLGDGKRLDLAAALQQGKQRGPARRLLTEHELRALERDNLQRTLEASGGRVYGPGGPAEALGIAPTTFISRLRAYGLAPERGRATR